MSATPLTYTSTQTKIEIENKQGKKCKPFICHKTEHNRQESDAVLN